MRNVMKIQLPTQGAVKEVNLAAILQKRATIREYLETPLSLANLAQLLSAGQGSRGEGEKLVTPSAQAQYPLSIFVLVKHVSGVSPGIYRYLNTDHTMVLHQEGEFSESLEKTAIAEQPWVCDAAAVVVLAGDITAMKKHFATQPPFHQRGERYTYIEAGAAAQNIQLQAGELGLGTVLVGGFYDDKVKALLMLPSALEPCAMLCVGNI